MDVDILQATVKRMFADGKGLLAADESNSTANERLAAAGVDETGEMRRQYRQLLLTTPGIEDELAGVILYDETFRQANDEGEPFVRLLEERGIVPGIKTDLGKRDLPNFPGEVVTQGLDNLAARNQEYYELGARFAKWRCVIAIDGDELPTEQCIAANVHTLVRYAGISQASGLVPIVEPEVLLDGDHTIERCQEVVTQTYQMLFEELQRFRVALDAVILKTSMVLPGQDSDQSVSPQQVAEATAATLKQEVPEELPGVVFLSGGQTPRQATEHLNEIVKLGPFPWHVSFSFSRALQDPVLTAWAGQSDNVAHAQQLFAERVKLASRAQQGQYTTDMEPKTGPAARSPAGQDEQ